MAELEGLLDRLASGEGTDLHLKVGSPPLLRVEGGLVRLDDEPLSAVDLADLAAEVMPAHRKLDFEQAGECDFAHSVPGVGRFRINVHRQRGSTGIVVRQVPPGTVPIDELSLPPAVAQLADAAEGLLVVSGPRGSGTTTTIAAIIDRINETRAVSIMTIEDPIEVLHTDKRAAVSQREVGTDTPSFAEGMRRSIYHDADVVFVGELRDDATAAAAIEAAETGRLVITSMGAPRAEETVNRIVDFFAPFRHRQIRHSLANALAGIVCQRLVPRADGKGKVPAVEILVDTPKVYDLIATPSGGGSDPTGGTETLTDVMAEGRYHGMQTLDQALLELLRAGTITPRTAVSAAADAQELAVAIQAAGLG